MVFVRINEQGYEMDGFACRASTEPTTLWTFFFIPLAHMALFSFHTIAAHEF